MDAEPDPAGGEGRDEIALQRGKRRAALMGRSVPGRPAMTLGELAEEARTASREPGSADGVQRFLAETGHSRETIAAVLGCLDFPGTEATGVAGDVVALPGASFRQQRLRTLAQLEARLLEE